MELEKGLQRWVVEISKWNPSLPHFSFAMSFLPHHEHSSITRFVKLEDRKRALVSRLLQYALVHRVLEIPFGEIIIRRTPEGKPFLVCDNVKSRFPNFNFNVSHHGDYVAIASEPICLVGLDIVSHSIPVNETAGEFVRSFSSCFSSLEWYRILNAGSSDEMLKIFYSELQTEFKEVKSLMMESTMIELRKLLDRYWCLKEAFVKAMGSGVGYKLDDVEFHHKNWDNISIKVAGKELNDWKFWLRELGHNHSVSIARGHPRTALKSYMKTLKQTEFDENEYNLGLHLPNASFTFLTVEDLIQICDRADSTYIDVSRNPRDFYEDETE